MLGAVKPRKLEYAIFNPSSLCPSGTTFRSKFNFCRTLRLHFSAHLIVCNAAIWHVSIMTILRRKRRFLEISSRMAAKPELKGLHMFDAKARCRANQSMPGGEKTGCRYTSRSSNKYICTSSSRGARMRRSAAQRRPHSLANAVWMSSRLSKWSVAM